eukprot:scaffold109937_cov69-Attheya_sp.AAC.2
MIPNFHDLNLKDGGRRDKIKDELVKFSTGHVDAASKVPSVATERSNDEMSDDIAEIVDFQDYLNRGVVHEPHPAQYLWYKLTLTAKVCESGSKHDCQNDYTF